MGTYIDTYFGHNSKIPESKVPEFEARLEKIFQAGGMMEIDKICMYGIDTCTIRKARMRQEKGLNAYYNYFEEDRWENAGYSAKKKHVWSNKVGWREFSVTITAAHILETLYTDGAAAVFANGDFVDEDIYTGWINYLFEEDFRAKNRNPWELFEALEQTPESEKFMVDVDWSIFAGTVEGMVGYTQIYAVKNGISAMLKWHADLLEKAGEPYADEDHSFNFFTVTQLIVYGIRSYEAESVLPKEQQLKQICTNLRTFYQKPDLQFADFDEECNLDNNQKRIFLGMYLMNLPVIAVKTIAEVYDRDFWQLWGELCDVVHESKRKFPMQLQDPPAEKISTQKLFRRKSDDMIYYWQKDGDIQFSSSLQKWFRKLRKKFDKIVESEPLMPNPMKWILEMMLYAQEEYYNIFTFTEFFEESVKHLSDKRYLALWMLYENMLHDPKLEEAGKVIFVPDGSEHVHEGIHSSSGKEPRHRLEYSWCVTEIAKRENRARVTLRRYMALVANVELRKEVFGF